jgi:hypothetical protein
MNAGPGGAGGHPPQDAAGPVLTGPARVGSAKLQLCKPLEAEGMFFVWTPQRIRIVVYFFAAYLALC